MQIYLAKRHFVNNEGNLRLLEDSVKKFETFRNLNDSMKFPVELSLLVSADVGKKDPESDIDKLSYDQCERAKRAISSIRSLGFEVWHDPTAATAGQKFVYQIYNKPLPSDASEPVRGLCCFDQWPLEKEEQLDAVIALGEKLLRDKKLYACGSRNVPVKLGIYQNNSDMRIIHELVQLLATRNDSFRAEKPEWANPSRSYAHFGELTSGFYLFNPAHPLYPIQRKEVLLKRREVFEKPGFSIDYFSAIHAGLHNAVASGYVYAQENTFPATVTEEVENKKFKDFNIKIHTSLVGKTSVRPALESILNDRGELGRLNMFFDPSLVEQTVELMREGLKS
ncbi:hypothetical protein HYW75_06305 [Candidatus Pacearchaeota archaeon]|nr:hypothetical protein [Candidatus Pacearchaeota archaeon]